MVVVFPAPFGPRKPKTSPGRTSSVTCSRIVAGRPQNPTGTTLLRASVRMAKSGGMANLLTWSTDAVRDTRPFHCKRDGRMKTGKSRAQWHPDAHETGLGRPRMGGGGPCGGPDR